MRPKAWYVLLGIELALAVFFGLMVWGFVFG